MSRSQSQKQRRKSSRAGELPADALRGHWSRKPATQVQPNRKAQERRTHCRRPGSSDGAFSLFVLAAA